MPPAKRVKNTKPAKAPISLFPFMSLPPELHIKVYRQYFNEMPKISIIRPIGTLGSVVGLLHLNSQIRQEAAPIFYKEHVGTVERHSQLRCWGLPDGNGPAIIKRFKAVTQSVAACGTNIKLAFGFDNQAPELQLSWDFLEALLAHIKSQVPGFMYKSPIEEYNKQMVKQITDRKYNLVETSGGFSTIYRVRRIYDDVLHERFVLKGPIAEIDWDGFSFDWDSRTTNIERCDSRITDME